MMDMYSYIQKGQPIPQNILQCINELTAYISNSETKLDNSSTLNNNKENTNTSKNYRNSFNNIEINDYRNGNGRNDNNKGEKGKG